MTDAIQTAIVTAFALGAAGIVTWKVAAPWFRRSQASCGKCDSPACGTEPHEQRSPLIQIQGLKK